MTLNHSNAIHRILRLCHVIPTVYEIILNQKGIGMCNNFPHTYKHTLSVSLLAHISNGRFSIQYFSLFAATTATAYLSLIH